MFLHPQYASFSTPYHTSSKWWKAVAESIWVPDGNYSTSKPCDMDKVHHLFGPSELDYGNGKGVMVMLIRHIE